MRPKPVPRLLINPSSHLPGEKQTSLLFAGDFYVRPDHMLRVSDDLFDAGFAGLVRQSSFAIVNFEGALNRLGSPGIRKEGPHLALHPEAPALLRAAGFRALTLANNHAMDYGPEALRDTLQVCRDCGLQFAGAGLSRSEAMQPLKLSLAEDLRLQILSFCEREFGVSTGEGPGTAWLTSPACENAVRQARDESDIVVVCAHGGNEFMPLPSAQRRQQLKNLIDAGADLVVAHHPHVPQGWEQYGAGYIFYSLGDFYFDSLDGRRYSCRDWGYLLRARIVERHISSLEVLPYQRANEKLTLGMRDAASCLAYLEKVSAVLAGPDFPAYWQQLAVDRLAEYRPFLRDGMAHRDASLRERARESLRLSRDFCRLWLSMPKPAASFNGGPPELSQTALGTLNVIRCESHRWAVETALAVLTGDCEDLRSSRVQRELQSMGRFYRYDFS